MATLAADAAAAAFREHERFVWGLCYRMTGSAADADDLAQETFVRALATPPPRTDLPWRPWLVRVAVNLARDHLRRRRRQGYVGPWLPAPVETGDGDASPPSFDPPAGATPAAAAGGDCAGVATAADARYEERESLTFAFLLALEALTPQQRAVLLLRDVLEYSVRETAAALERSEAGVKTTLHRARRAMSGYDRSRCVPTRERRERTARALGALLDRLAAGDVAGMEVLLAEDVVSLSDGGGEFHAARKPVIGRGRVARFFLGVAERGGRITRLETRLLNGLPALVIERDDLRPGDAPRFVMRCDVDDDGRIVALHSVLATRKLAALRF
ncbi:MAG TPA: sigma-70 family RNA polymerase sigma factor [Myxococcota bacterium]|jgi:RNA polymerase sigma-70 factor (ECF subfamily)|nr:sigma-70 family RNA polymerase sigma factor [Myxococcota bacterium]